MNTVDLPRDDVDIELSDGEFPVEDLRRQVSAAVVDAGADRTADVLLVAVELARNAYRHAESPRRMRLLFAPAGQAVRVEVDDASPSLLPVLGRVDTPEHGRGLLMVNRLAVHWGHLPLAEHKTVWAEVRIRA